MTTKRALWIAASLVAIAVLTAIYTRLSMTIPVNSDQANSALQGQDLANGNVLLKGWILSPISLYVPDLLMYAAIVAVNGLQPMSVHVTNALLYALVVVAAVVLARGSASSRYRTAAALITAVMLIAPQLGLGVRMLLLEGSHLGVTLLVILALIVLDRAPGSYLGLLLISAILTVAVIADGLVDVIGVGPVILVSALRLVRRGPELRYEWRLLVAGAASVPLGAAVVFAIRRLHGFQTYALSPAPAHLSDVPKYFGQAINGLVAFFGASFNSGGGLIDYFGAGLHWLGLTFAVGCAAYLAWHWLRSGTSDRVSELLLAGMVCDAGAFLLIAHGDTSRYLIPVYVFGAILAGRVGAAVIAKRELSWAAAGVAAGYCAVLLFSLGASPAPTTQPWSRWLLDHQMYSGLGSYWQASSVTLETGGRVRVRPILADGLVVNGYAWESKLTWYRRDELGDVRFVVYDVTDSQFGITRSAMETVFGPPVDSVRFGNVEVLVWDKNLVPSLKLDAG